MPPSAVLSVSILLTIKMIQHFPGQKEGEEIKYLIRKHWIVYCKLGLFLLLMVGVPFIFYLILELSFNFDDNLKRLISLGFLLYLNVTALISFIRWLEEDLDIIIVTNERVISIDQVSFMHRTISETELTQIQDVKHVAKGVLSNVMGFGTLEIQTAAEKIVFIIQDVPAPYAMARKIMDLRGKYKKPYQGGENHSGEGSHVGPI
jgi:hypothetical protein